MRSNESSHVARRFALAVGAVACLIVATVGTVDPGVPLSTAVRSIAVAMGLVTATILAWGVARMRGVSLSRDAMIPWWTLGASAAVIAAAAYVVPLSEHITFATVSVLRAGLAALGCRFAADAVLGPLPEIPWWAEEEEWIAVERAAMRRNQHAEAAD
jgi:hypothetical protein